MKHVLIALAILLVSACSVHYGQRVPGFIPGYVDEQLGDNTYQVKIGEAWPKDWPDLEKFAMYRASEITSSKGKRYFAVLDSSTQISNYTINMPTTTTTSGNLNVIGNTAYLNTRSTTYGGTSVPISGGWYSVDFKIIEDNEIENYKYVVDAQQVMKDLKYFIDKRR